MLKQQGKEVILLLHIQPNASKTEIVGLHNGALKIRIKAPPVDGKANIEIIEFIATIFAVPKRSVEIIGGSSSRQKRVLIQNVSLTRASQILESLGT